MLGFMFNPNKGVSISTNPFNPNKDISEYMGQTRYDKPIGPTKPYTSIYDNKEVGDLRDYINNLLSSSQSSGGGVSANRIDVTPLINSMRQSAQSQKDIINTKTSNTRQQLLDSLKRFQEDTAEARKQQRSAYNSARADIEEQAFLNNRTAAQQAAARGLGGSGLQQLAQIQSQIASSKATNEVAQDNKQVQEGINKAARQKEEDTTSNIKQLEEMTAQELAQIESNLNNAINEIKYNEDVRYENARQQAAQYNSSMNNYANSVLNDKLQLIDMGLSQIDSQLAIGINQLKDAFNSSNNKKKRNEAVKGVYNSVLENINTIMGDSFIPSAQRDAINKQWENYFNQYYQ